MSTLAFMAATAALAFLLGRTTTRPALRRLRRDLAAALHQAHHDPLTGLPNRGHAAGLFTERAVHAQATTVALIDLDHFKSVNDTHGHDAGDALLTAVAERLSTAAADHGGVAARLAGDEFLLLLPAADGDHIHPVAAALVALTPPIAVTTADGAVATITARASAGMTVFDGLADTFTGVLRQADIALYHAKQQHDRIAVYHPGLHMPPLPRRRRMRDQRPAHRHTIRRQVQP